MATYYMRADGTALFYQVTNVEDNGSGLVKMTMTWHPFVTGDKVAIGNVTMAGTTVVNGDWTVTRTSSTIFTLNGSAFVGGDSYTSGGWVIYSNSGDLAANKTLGPATHNLPDYANAIHPGSTIYLLTDGGDYNTYFFCRSQGTDGNPITYNGSYGGNYAQLGARLSVTGTWTETGAGSNIWYITISTSVPTITNFRLWLDGTEALRASSSTVDSTEKFYWDNSTKILYLYSTSDPSVAFTTIQRTGGFYFATNGKDYITIKNIHFGYSYSSLIAVDGSTDVIVEDNEIGYGTCHIGVYLNNSDGTIIRNNTFATGLNSLGNTFKADKIYVEDGVYFNNTVSNTLIHDNTFSDWSHAAIAAWATTGAITSNKIYDNFITASNLNYGKGFNFDSTGSGSGTGNEIYRNFVYNTATTNQLNAKGTKFYNNIIYGVYSPLAVGAYAYVGRSGLSLNGYTASEAQELEIYNNVIGNCEGHGLWIEQTGGTPGDISDNLLENNIIFNCGSTNTDYQVLIANDTDINTNTIKNNLIYKSGVTNLVSYRGTAKTITEFNAADAESDVIADNIGGDPLFINAGGSYALANDFKLQSTSPAKGAGTDVNVDTDYNGFTHVPTTAPSIGTHSFGHAQRVRHYRR